MAKRFPLDELLSAVTRAKREPLSAQSLATLRTALAGKHSVLIEQAAVAAKELFADDLKPDMVAAFERCTGGQVDDKSMLATTALVDALQELRYDDPDLFLRGLRVFRPSPGGDLAAGVRSAAAFGLVRCRYRNDIWELAALLNDKAASCRITAARAMALAGTELAVPLLKFKILSGDADGDVTAECLTALMSLAPALALPFVAARLDHEDSYIAEAAALALGESRRPEALPELSRRIGFAAASTRRVLLLAVGLLRSEEGVAYLLDRVTHAEVRTASDAVAALSLYKQDSGVKARLAAAVETNGAAGVREAFAREFR